MTIKEHTICNLLQSFPVLLILAQNASKCLKTPLIYKPPTPTQSPEYYEALDALFQSLYGHSNHGNHPGNQVPQHGYQVHEDPNPSYPSQTSCPTSYGYGKKLVDSLGGSYYKPCYQYVYTNGYRSYGSSLQGYQSYGLTKGNIYALYSNATNMGYAPREVYNNNSRYKVVIKKTKIGSKRSSGKAKGLFRPRENQNRPLFGFLGGGNRVMQGMSGLFGNQQRREPNYQLYPQTTNYPGNGMVMFPDGQNGYNGANQGNYRPGLNQNGPGNYDNRPAYNQQGQNGYNNGGMVIVDGGQGMGETQIGNGVVFGDMSNAYQPTQAVPENDPVNFEEASSPVTIPPVTTTVASTTTLAPTTAAPVTTTLPPLTPVATSEPQSDSRNSLSFGSQGPFAKTCTTVEGGDGNCISVYECPQYLALLQQSSTNPEVVQLLRKAHCGFEGSNPKVCCPLNGIPATPQPSLPSSTTTTTTTPVPAPSPKFSTEDLVPALPDPPNCGVSNASFSRVVGGVDAKLGDFPWVALLGYNNSRLGTTNWACGGSLISSKHVLTAAHCIHNHEKDLYVVRLGELDLSKEDEGATPVDFLIKKKIKHEKYDPKAYTNDIAILVLEGDVQFTDLIRPICIPKESELRGKSFEDYTPLIAGWGQTNFRGPSAPHLQVVQLPVVSNEFCAQAYTQYKSQVIDERTLCAGYKKGGKDACKGDSGGPLMQPIWTKQYKTYFYQIGVVSYGKGCAEAGFPGVYSRVTHFVPWIMETVVGHS